MVASTSQLAATTPGQPRHSQNGSSHTCYGALSPPWLRIIWVPLRSTGSLPAPHVGGLAGGAPRALHTLRFAGGTDDIG